MADECEWPATWLAGCPLGRHIWGMTTNYGGEWVASATQHSRRLEPAYAPGPIDDAAQAPARHETTKGSTALRRILVVLDATAVTVAWTVALLVPDGLDTPGFARLPNII